jgi:hypothetical protein
VLLGKGASAGRRIGHITSPASTEHAQDNKPITSVSGSGQDIYRYFPMATFLAMRRVEGVPSNRTWRDNNTPLLLDRLVEELRDRWLCKGSLPRASYFWGFSLSLVSAMPLDHDHGGKT